MVELKQNKTKQINKTNMPKVSIEHMQKQMSKKQQKGNKLSDGILFREILLLPKSLAWQIKVRVSMKMGNVH